MSPARPRRAYVRLTVLAAAATATVCGRSEQVPPAEAAADLTGAWSIVAHHIPGTSAMTDVDAEVWHRRAVRLVETGAVSPVGYCDNPTYTARLAATDSLLEVGYRIPPGSLPLAGSPDRIPVLDVSCDGADWAAMGGFLIGLDEDRALAPWDGVFFELRREDAEAEADFVGRGNEPFWLLEILDGSLMRFRYAVEEREANTPVPEPEIDEATGTIVYHAITEANDLRVVIDPALCFDDMSGAPFSRTVTVTLNGEVHRGCGEPVP